MAWCFVSARLHFSLKKNSSSGCVERILMACHVQCSARSIADRGSFCPRSWMLDVLLAASGYVRVNRCSIFRTLLMGWYSSHHARFLAPAMLCLRRLKREQIQFRFCALTHQLGSTNAMTSAAVSRRKYHHHRRHRCCLSVVSVSFSSWDSFYLLAGLSGWQLLLLLLCRRLMYDFPYGQPLVSSISYSNLLT